MLYTLVTSICPPNVLINLEYWHDCIKTFLYKIFLLKKGTTSTQKLKY